MAANTLRVYLGAAFSVTLLLAACGGGGSQDQAGGALQDASSAKSCDSITGGGAQVTSSVDPGCADCSISDKQSAADGDISTFASMTVNQAAPGQGVSIRATAQPGIAFSAGQNAGAFIDLACIENGGSTELLIRTYRSGTLQETDTERRPGDIGTQQNCGQSGFFGFQTLQPFDAVEVFISNNQTGGEPVFKIHEICSNGAEG